MSQKRITSILLMIIIFLAILNFIQYINPRKEIITSIPSQSEVRIRVSTTTSLYATGLLDYLASQFNKLYPNVKIDFIAVGSSAALKIAERGDACIVFSHAPEIEEQYIEKGVIDYGRIIAYNYFIIVGPLDDPAGIRNASSAEDAFRKIYEACESGKTFFISRGDNSGTHIKELSIWKKIGIDPHGKSWYREAGAGMDQVLIMSNEMKAYTLSDTGTYLQFKKEGRLPNIEELFYNDSSLINIYSIYIVRNCSSDLIPYARAFIDFIYYNQRDIIGKFGIDKYGAPLFIPAIDKEKELACEWLKIARGY
jgi:tungstate transport system substrate-binding protein